MLSYDSLMCRSFTACIFSYSVFIMRREERNYPKDVQEMKERDERRKQERLQRRAKTLGDTKKDA